MNKPVRQTLLIALVLSLATGAWFVYSGGKSPPPRRSSKEIDSLLAELNAGSGPSEILVSTLSDTNEPFWQKYRIARDLLDSEYPEAGRVFFEKSIASKNDGEFRKIARGLLEYVDRDRTKTWGVRQLAQVLRDDRLDGEQLREYSHALSYHESEVVLDAWMFKAERLHQKYMAEFPATGKRTASDLEQPVWALGYLKNKSVEPLLLHLLVAHLELVSKYDWSAEWGFSSELDTIVSALEGLGSVDAAHRLEAYAFDVDVIEALQAIGDKRCVPLLGTIVEKEGEFPLERLPDGIPKNPNGFNSAELKEGRLWRAEIAFTTLAPDDPIPPLLKLLSKYRLGENPDDWRMGEVIQAFENIPDKRVVPVLLELIATDSSSWVFCGSVRALAFIKCRESVTGLIGSFGLDFEKKISSKAAWTPEMFKGYIARALAEITGEDFGTDKEAWEKWWNSEGETRF